MFNNEMVGLKGGTPNHSPIENPEELFKQLEEWNDYLERYAPHFSQLQSLDQTREQHSRKSPKPRGLER